MVTDRLFIQSHSEKRQKEGQKEKKNVKFGMERQMRNFKVPHMKTGDGKTSIIIKEISTIKERCASYWNNKEDALRKRLYPLKVPSYEQQDHFESRETKLTVLLKGSPTSGKQLPV